MTAQHFHDLASKLKANGEVSEEQLVTIINLLCREGVSNVIKTDGALVQFLHHPLESKLCSSSSNLEKMRSSRNYTLDPLGWNIRIVDESYHV